MGCQGLRTELERLTVAPADVVGRQRVDRWLDDQIEAVAALRERYPHSITLHARSNAAIEEMNCFMYALGLETDAVREFCYGNCIFPGANFVSSLIGTVIKPKTDDAANGDFIVYFDETQMCPPDKDVTGSAIYRCHWVGRAAGGRGAPA